MKVRKLLIERFRGIKHLNWTIPSTNLICLIGPGDATKSTILDAIEYALSPRWSLPFNDADFYLCDTSQPFEIYVTVGKLPHQLISDEKLGLYLRGWSTDGQLRDEPSDNDELVLSHGGYEA